MSTKEIRDMLKEKYDLCGKPNLPVIHISKQKSGKKILMVATIDGTVNKLFDFDGSDPENITDELNSAWRYFCFDHKIYSSGFYMKPGDMDNIYPLYDNYRSIPA